MTLELKSVLDYGLQESAGVMNLGFSDYFVPIQLDAIKFHELLRTSHIDISLSKVVIQDGKALGIALIARRGWSSRLAGMSVIPEARRQKVGTWLMEQIIADSKTRGDRRMELEVIEQNLPAVYLYEFIGFRIMRRLVSWKLESPGGRPGNLIEIDIRLLADLVNIYGLPHLPWQLSGESLAALGPPNKAYRLDDAYVAISNPEADQIVLRSLLTLPKSRNKGQAVRLFWALFEMFPNKSWLVPAIFPEELSSLFEKLGFIEQELSQYQMELNY